MTRYALIYGAIAGAIAATVLTVGIASDLSNHTTSLWFGYLVMLVALSLIFVGIKRYRDVECGGVIRFGRAFLLGLGIAAVAGLIYAIVLESYLQISGYDFMADYTRSVLKNMQAEGASPAAIQAKAAEMNAMAESYKNPLFRIPMTFIEIFPVGIVVALISAGLLRNPKMLPARR
jgi:predicted small secreted protein